MTEVNSREEYIEALKLQVLDILNKVKEETGVDTPVEIIFKEEEEDDNE